jgi:CRP/FNR family transcriptional regulator, polysaccharide utilization system transcription regulator
MANPKIPDCRNCNAVACSIFTRSYSDNSFRPRKKAIQIKSGEFLFRENNPSSGVYCIQEGELLVLKKGSNKTDQILASALPGEILGISSILNNDIYTTSLLAIKDVKACFFAREEFLSLVRNFPVIGMATLGKLGNKLKILEEKV